MEGSSRRMGLRGRGGEGQGTCGLRAGPVGAPDCSVRAAWGGAAEGRQAGPGRGPGEVQVSGSPLLSWSVPSSSKL